MRIGINGRFLIAKQTGVQRAAYNLVTTLVKNDRKNSYFLFTGEREVGKVEWDFPNVEVVASNIREGETFKNLFWEQVTLVRLAHKYKIDILHSPANMAPLFYRGKSIIHIHDLCFIVNPQWYSFSFRTWYKLVIPRLAHNATKIITNSNNSRNDLLQFCKIGLKKVNLVYWAVDEKFLAANASDDLVWDVDDYVLYVGSLEPRKNIKTLVEAFEAFRRKNPDLKTKLVLIGGESPLFADVSLNIKEFQDDIIFKGFVDEDDLRRYYRHAKLFVYPSLYEGFGLPPLEAMACGTPVVTSRTSSIPEVVGDAALLVSPHVASQIVDAMTQVLRSPSLRQDLIERGHRHARRYSWVRVARNVLAIYHEVHNDRLITLREWKKLNPVEYRH